MTGISLRNFVRYQIRTARLTEGKGKSSEEGNVCFVRVISLSSSGNDDMSNDHWNKVWTEKEKGINKSDLIWVPPVPTTSKSGNLYIKNRVTGRVTSCIIYNQLTYLKVISYRKQNQRDSEMAY